MLTRSYLAERLIFIFIAGLIGLQYPILLLFNLEMTFWGIPILYLYLFVVWAFLIVVLYALIGRRQKKKVEDTTPS